MPVVAAEGQRFHEAIDMDFLRHLLGGLPVPDPDDLIVRPRAYGGHPPPVMAERQLLHRIVPVNERQP